MAIGGDCAPFRPFTVRLPVAIRPCRREDLPTLEWFGLFTPQRRILLDTFERHERGEAVMLVAEANGVASGQAWIDPTRRERDATGVIWAVRVFPCLQRLGIGARLMDAAEWILRARGFERVEVTVQKHNTGARRFYERRGYRVEGEVRDELRYVTPDGLRVREPMDQWVMRKDLK